MDASQPSSGDSALQREAELIAARAANLAEMKANVAYWRPIIDKHVRWAADIVSMGLVGADALAYLKDALETLESGDQEGGEHNDPTGTRR